MIFINNTINQIVKKQILILLICSLSFMGGNVTKVSANDPVLMGKIAVTAVWACTLCAYLKEHFSSAQKIVEMNEQGLVVNNRTIAWEDIFSVGEPKQQYTYSYATHNHSFGTIVEDSHTVVIRDDMGKEVVFDKQDLPIPVPQFIKMINYFIENTKNKSGEKPPMNFSKVKDNPLVSINDALKKIELKNNKPSSKEQSLKLWCLLATLITGFVWVIPA